MCFYDMHNPFILLFSYSGVFCRGGFDRSESDGDVCEFWFVILGFWVSVLVHVLTRHIIIGGVCEGNSCRRNSECDDCFFLYLFIMETFNFINQESRSISATRYGRGNACITQFVLECFVSFRVSVISALLAVIIVVTL